MLKTGDTFEQCGRTWKFVGLDKPCEMKRSNNDCFINTQGEVSLITNYCCQVAIPIVEEVVPEWITPTDEDAKQRPECEVRDCDNHEWKKRKLIYVRPYAHSYPFVTDFQGQGECCWSQCRIRNPDYKD